MKKLREIIEMAGTTNRWLIFHPDGKKEVIRNLTNFSKKNNLNHVHMYNVAAGRSTHHKGYRVRRLENDDSDPMRHEPLIPEMKKRGYQSSKKWTIVHPDGKEENIESLRRFSKERGLSYDSMFKSQLLGMEYKGYKIKKSE